MPKKAVTALLFLVFVDLMGFGMLIPDVQLRAEKLGAAGWIIGVTLSCMFVVQAICSPAWGALSDRVGRKPVILICTSLSAASMLIYTQATSILVIVASRVVSGLGAANVSIAQAALAESVSLDQRTTVMGYVGSATTSGLIVGPAIGGILAASGGPVLLGATACAFSFSGVLAVSLLMPKVDLKSKPRTARSKETSLRSNKALLTLFVIATVSWFALACLEGTFGRLLKHRFDLGQLAFGLIFAYESFLSAVVQGTVVKSLSKHLGERRLLAVGMTAQGVGLGAMPFLPNLAWLTLAATAYSLGSALAGPAINGWCSKVTPESQQGAMFGLLQSARSLGFMVGPMIGGALFDWRISAPYVLAATTCGAAVATVLLVTRDPARSEPSVI
jgi:MFS family permease